MTRLIDGDAPAVAHIVYDVETVGILGPAWAIGWVALTAAGDEIASGHAWTEPVGDPATVVWAQPAPQFAPQPGDTMSDTEDAMYTYTVTSVEGDGDPHGTWVHSTHPDGTSGGGWPLYLWSEDCDGRFVYARPG